MGALAAATLADAHDLSLAALVDPRPLAATDGAVWAASVEDLEPDAVDVLVDLTRPEVARRTLAWVTEHGKDAVVGTSGLREADLDAARAAAGTSRILVVPNFSIGAVLLQRFAVAAAAHFERVEVIELHHDKKRDAPSGTSIATATALAAARRAAGLGDLDDPTEHETLPGSRGAAGPGGVRVHSVRLPGLLAHQEVLFGGPGEGLVLRHDSYDRESFMGGLLAGGAPPRAGHRPRGRPRARPRRVSVPQREVVRERILEGTSRAICAAGVRQTSLEDIARESGCSRATVYRHFPGGRDELLASLVAFEHRRFFVRLGQAVEDATTLEEVMERGLMVAHRALAELEVLQIVLREQPELLEPTLVRAGRPTLRLVADFLAPYLAAHGVATIPTRPPRTRTSSRAWCSATSRRPGASTSTTWTRSERSFAASSWAASWSGRADGCPRHHPRARRDRGARVPRGPGAAPHHGRRRRRRARGSRERRCTARSPAGATRSSPRSSTPSSTGSSTRCATPPRTPSTSAPPSPRGCARPRCG